MPMTIEEQLLVFEYIGEHCATQGDWFFGFLGSFHQWTWPKPSEKKHHVYRKVERPKRGTFSTGVQL